jgi:SAM-dependent methyltransferase
MPPIDARLVGMLRCPVTGGRVRESAGRLVTDAGRTYAVTDSGIPLFEDAGLSADARAQQAHYDWLAPAYIRNLLQPHTREYIAYLDRQLLTLIGEGPIGRVAELCCGGGEGLQLLGSRAQLGVGVDVSTAMLEHARRAIPSSDRLFVQGDAVNLPLGDEQADAVLMLGGIHHVNDRRRLYGEVRRILRPGGRFYWREPVDDFAPWRAARSLVYRWSPALESDTERPLRFRQTRDDLTASGLRLTAWQTAGFIGYCLLMNTDVLAVNRLWAYLPCSRAIARAAAAFDDVALKLPGLGLAGALAIGSAVRME